MYLGEGYNKGLCGGVNKEFKEVNGVTKAVVLYNWENDGVFAQERFPEGQWPYESIGQTGAFPSC